MSSGWGQKLPLLPKQTPPFSNCCTNPNCGPTGNLAPPSLSFREPKFPEKSGLGRAQGQGQDKKEVNSQVNPSPHHSRSIGLGYFHLSAGMEIAGSVPETKTAILISSKKLSSHSREDRGHPDPQLQLSATQLQGSLG